jgi:hypothetical protein
MNKGTAVTFKDTKIQKLTSPKTDETPSTVVDKISLEEITKVAMNEAPFNMDSKSSEIDEAAKLFDQTISMTGQTLFNFPTTNGLRAEETPALTLTTTSTSTISEDKPISSDVTKTTLLPQYSTTDLINRGNIVSIFF